LSNYLAVDLGAESGRVMLGTLGGGRIALDELHRFPNTPVRLPTGLYWDTLRLFHEIQQGLAVAGRQRRLQVAGIGVDTWGVDIALLGSDGQLVEDPHHYRDNRNDGMVERVFGVVPREEVFEATGIQIMQINSLFQLYAAKLGGGTAVDAAARLLFMPDLFNYWLTGVQRAELTIASTSQFYDPRRRAWASGLFERLGLPTRILPEIVPPGTALGPLLPHVAEATGLSSVMVYASAGHDTAAAVASVPAGDGPWCYISSGTWSLMGVELAEPLINARSLAHNFTNEVGVGGRIRFLKNIAGLWVLQECRRHWASEGLEYSYDDLARMAAAAPALSAIVDPDAFLHPGNMPKQIAAYCARTGQAAPADEASLARAILEGLALRYRQVLAGLEELLDGRIGTIHIVGGGSRNSLLNQFVADATGRRVVAGPVEATALGNVIAQAIGAGELEGLEEARAVVRASFPVAVFEPRPGGGWDAAYERYLALRS